MITQTSPTFATARASGVVAPPKNLLNCYEILNACALSQPVNIYRVEFSGPADQTHETRGRAKQVIWELRKEHRIHCRGYGFVVDLNPWDVAVPASWQLPAPVAEPEYRVIFSRSLEAKSTDPEGRAIITGIVREAIKKHFKDNLASELGDLWQDYDGFCQYPPTNGDEDYLMCRRFSFSVKILAGGIFAVQTCVSTTTVDGRTLADYYRAGDVAILAEMIEAKRANRLTRDSQPVGVRALRQFADGNGPARAIDLDDVEEILAHAKLAPNQQRSYERSSIRCKPFKQPCVDVPLSELRLILGSQITQDEHEETIIEPGERAQWMRKMRDFVHGADVCGQNLQLSEDCVDDERFDSLAILPPAVRVRGANGQEALIPGATNASEAELRERVRSRMDHIRKNGFLDRRSINPVLALPSSFGQRRGERLKTDLEMIWAGQGIEATFATVYFQSAEEVRRAVEDGGHDAVLAVLPEGSRRGRSANDTHEQLKRRLDVPSQCIQHDNTLPPKWCSRSWHELTQADGKLARRIRQRYELCLGNLLVKHHCFPFAPQDAFHYNVHVGLDVGGVHNTHAVACIGYGFAQPRDGLLFRPEEIPIEVQKKEPIPTRSLFAGLLDLFDRIHSDLKALGITPDFGSVLFHRDGALLGDGDAWNERDALFNLCAELKRRRWIGDEARWTVAEILKLRRSPEVTR